MLLAFLDETWRHRLTRLADFALVGLGVIALGCLLADLGWELTTEQQLQLARTTTGVLVFFVCLEVGRWLWQPKLGKYLRTRWAETTVAAFATIELVFAAPLRGWLGSVLPWLTPQQLSLMAVSATQITVLLMIFLRVVRLSRRLAYFKVSPSWLLILSFGTLVAIGTGALLLPEAAEQPLTFVQALFLSTSAVCVTGLAPLDIATALTPMGQIILLILIQLGGLGIMTITYFFAFVLAGGVSLRDQRMLQELLSEEGLGHLGGVLGLIVGSTLLIEGVGALLLKWTTPAGVEVSWFDCVFHAISAYCNAGFSTFPGGLPGGPWATVWGPQFVIMVLIVTGGIGFPVFLATVQAGQVGLTRVFRGRVCAPPRLNTHTRVVLFTTFVLLTGGALVLFWAEHVVGTGRQAVAVAPWWDALFLSVTARTAGFNTTDVSGLMPLTLLILMVLMYIGGSPGGTAGGVKTTVFAITVLNLWRILRERDSLEMLGRRVATEVGRRCFAIMTVALLWVGLATIALLLLEPDLPKLALVFEVVSALGTVGLSMNLTAELGDGALLVVVACMFVGRIGVFTFLQAFVPRAPEARISLPEDRIVLV